MAVKDLNNTLYDLAQFGLLIGRKAFARALADEAKTDPSVVGQLVARLHPERIEVEVSEVIEETPSTRTLRLIPSGPGPLPPFRAGQFVNVFVTVDGVRTGRPYSISSPPCRREYLDITVRRMPDGFVSVHLCDAVRPGDRLELSGPAGFFYHEPLVDTTDLVFLAGGSGITPFMSMVRQAVETREDLRIHVVYGSRVPDDVIFEEELAEIACSKSNVRLDLVMSEPPEDYTGACGVLDAKMIGELVGDIEGKTFYVCGPQAMYDLCLPSLDSLGVPSKRIKREVSGPPPDITAVEGWPAELEGDTGVTVMIEGTEQKLKARCTEPLLNTLERNGFTIDNLCRSGECGVCRTRLVEGEVFTPPSVTVRRADLAFGYIHPCMSYPVSDITIRL